MASFTYAGRRAFAWLSFLLLLALVGCASGYIASPAPNPVLAGATLVSAPADDGAGPFQILYVTNLKPAEDGSGLLDFEAEAVRDL